MFAWFAFSVTKYKQETDLLNRNLFCFLIDNSIRMKELRSAEMNLKTGMTLYGTNPTKAEPEFTGNVDVNHTHTHARTHILT